MDAFQRTAKNSGLMFIGEAFIKLLDFIIVIYLARYMGSSDFGVYSFVFTYIFLFSLLPTLGINKIIVREIAKNNSIAGKIIGNALIIRILLSCLAIFLALIIINLLNYQNDIKILVYIASITLLFSSIRLTFQIIFTAYLEMKYSEFAAVIGKMISLFLILAIIFLKGSIFHIVIAIVISGFFDLLIVFIFFRKFAQPMLTFDLSISKKILTASLPLTLAIFIGILFSRVDIMMLSLMKTNQDVGIYSAAFKLTDSLNIIPISLIASLFPLMSKYHKNSDESLISTYEQGFKLLLIIGLPIAVISTVFSKTIILFIFGSQFLLSSTVLSILIWAEAFMFINILFNNVLISMKKEFILLFISIIMGMSNIILNYLLIPQYSYIGASIATIFTITTGATINYYYINTRLIKKSFNFTILKIILTIILLYLFLILINHMPLIITIPISMIFYISILVMFKLIVKEEIDIFKGFVQNIANSLKY